MLKTLCVLFFVLGMSAGVSHAEEDTPPLPPLAQVHFFPFEYGSPGPEDYVYFTLFLDPVKWTDLLSLCKMEPRIREAVNSLLLGRRDLHKMGVENPYMKKASAALHKRINAATGGKLVKRTVFMRGEILSPAKPIEQPSVPNPLNCAKIFFQAKSISKPDD